jgi:hypothetical protein
MNVFILFAIGYLGLSAYLIYQAIMLDKFAKEIKRLQPPF